MEKENLEKDKLLWGLIEAGHNAIFVWVAVYVASGIGLIQMIIEILKIHTLLSFSLMVFGAIYFVLVCLMTLSLYSIFKIMYQQNSWANKLYPKESPEKSDLSKIYFGSRSRLSKCMVGETDVMTTWVKIGLVLHFLGFLGFGLGIWHMNLFFYWFIHIWGL
jgi:hypothetical protein